MNAEPEATTEQLEQKLKTAQTVRYTSIGIFAVIILAWVVLGYWQTRLPVFIVTVCLAVTISLVTSMRVQAIKQQLSQKRS